MLLDKGPGFLMVCVIEATRRLIKQLQRDLNNAEIAIIYGLYWLPVLALSNRVAPVPSTTPMLSRNLPFFLLSPDTQEVLMLLLVLSNSTVVRATIKKRIKRGFYDQLRKMVTRASQSDELDGAWAPQLCRKILSELQAIFEKRVDLQDEDWDDISYRITNNFAVHLSMTLHSMDKPDRETTKRPPIRQPPTVAAFLDATILALWSDRDFWAIVADED